MLMPSRVRLLLTGHPELTAVLAAAVLGLSVQPPLAWLASHQGINILLAILVFATAVTIEPAALRSLTRTWLSLLTALAAGIPVLPALSWAVSQIVAAGPLRDGIMTSAWRRACEGRGLAARAPDRMSLAEVLLFGGECAPGERLTGTSGGLVCRGVAVGDAQASVDGEHGLIAVRGRCLAV
jgi:hypothetical protein